MAGNILDMASIGSVGSIFGGSDNMVSGSQLREEGADFASVLKNAIAGSLENTQSLIDQSEQAEIDFALGNADNTNELGIALRKASLAVSYTVALRDRFLDAYKEIMQIQI